MRPAQLRTGPVRSSKLCTCLGCVWSLRTCEGCQKPVPSPSAALVSRAAKPGRPGRWSSYPRTCAG
eukprot:scaffold22752_cov52-Phaeocystis_antarctica.AAC.10